MKNIWLRSAAFLVSVALFFSCNDHPEETSLFEFFPKSKQELKANGYKYRDMNGAYYYKTIGDTLDRIRELNAGSDNFSKEVYVKTLSKDKDTVRMKEILIMKLIGEKADDILFTHYNYQVVRMRKNYFLISSTVFGSLTEIKITYNNLLIDSERKSGISYIEQLQKLYPDSANMKQLSDAIFYMKNFKQ